MYPRCAALAALTLTLSLAPTTASAADPWDGKPFAGDANAIATAAARVTADADQQYVRILEDVVYRFDSRAGLQKSRRQVIKIINRQGARQWSEHTVPWSPWLSQKPTLRARVIGTDGTVVTLAQSDVSVGDPQNPARPGQATVVRAALPPLAPGSVLELVTTTRLKPRDGASHELRLSTYATRRTRVLIDAPTSLSLRYRAWNIAAKPSVRRSGSRKRIAYDIAAKEHAYQLSLPRGQSWYPLLLISTAPSWQAVARQQHAAIEASLASGLPTAANVPARASRDKTIHAVLDFVQDHLTAHWQSFSQRGAARSLADIWKTKEGDNREIAGFTVALLKAAGIRSQVALISSDNIGIVPSMPGDSRLDRALVFVPGKKPMWLDPMRRFAKLGELDPSDQDRRALVLARNTKKLLRTPRSTAADNTVVEVRNVYVSDFGRGRIVENATYRGFPAQTMRLVHRKDRADAARKDLQEYAKELYLADQEPKARWSEPTDLAADFAIHIETKGSLRSNCDAERCEIYMPISSLFSQLDGAFTNEHHGRTLKSRKRSYAITRPHVYTIEYRVHLPNGWRISSTPPNETRNLGGALFTRTVTRSASSVTVRAQLRATRAVLTADAMRTMREHVMTISGGTPMVIVLEHQAVADANAGKVVRALSTLRKLAAASPSTATQRWRMIDIVMAVGLREAAVLEARRAVAIDDSAISHAYLGWALTHDALGRQYHPGYDRAEAIKELTRAVTLDPSYAWAHGQLAQLQEHDASGYRYRGDLNAAVAGFAKAKALEDRWTPGLQNALAVSRSWPDVEKLATAANSEPNLVVAAVAAMHGAARAIARARAINRNDPATLVDGAVSVLVIAGEYTAARALLDDGIRAGVVGTTLSGLQAMFQRLRPWRNALHKVGDPRRVVQLEFARQLGHAGGRKARVKHLSRTATLLDEDNPQQLVRTARRMAREKQVGSRAILDSLLSESKMTIAERKPWGIRIEMRFGNETLQAFVVREGNRHKLLSAGWAVPLAARALRELRRGKTSVARGWLEWASITTDGRRHEAPFVTLWTEERGASHGALERAAGSLMIGTKLTRRGVPFVDSCPASNVKVFRACASALAGAAFKLEDGAMMKRALKRIDAHTADDDQNLWFRGSAAGIDGDWDTLLALATTRLKQKPRDASALHAESVAVCGKSTPIDCHRKLLSALTKPGGDALKNAVAWQALTAGVHDDAMLRIALEDTITDRRANNLNTLAAVQAARGEVQAAHRSMMASLAMEESSEADEADWLVQGRIAAACGYPAIARKRFRSIKSHHPHSHHGHSWDVAQRWLADLKTP